MKSSKVIAIMIALFVGGWTFSGLLVADENVDIITPNTEREEKIIDVRVKNLIAQDFADDLVITGRSHASRTLEIKAEVEGALTSLEKQEGAIVKKGDRLAVIEVRDRKARLAEARQRVTQRQIEYDAARALESKGFSSRIRLSQAEADLENAKAALKQAEVNMDKVHITSPFDGVLFEQAVETGNYLKAGDLVFTLVDLDPIEFVGFAPERHIRDLKLDTPARIEFLNGDTVEGKVSYIAPGAREDTRTFRVIVTAENDNAEIKAGLTAKLYIPLPDKKAHKISPSILALNDEGQIGVKIVDDKNHVRFYPVDILSDKMDGMWISGLPARVQIITVGQEFVMEGQSVNPVPSRSEGLL